jgi:hypothetical protein
VVDYLPPRFVDNFVVVLYSGDPADPPCIHHGERG